MSVMGLRCLKNEDVRLIVVLIMQIHFKKFRQLFLEGRILKGPGGKFKAMPEPAQPSEGEEG